MTAFFMVNLNGSIHNTDEASISLNNRAVHYGDAVFETVRFSENHLFFWEDHYFRFMASMRILRMEIPMNFTMEFLESEIRKVIPERESNNPFRIKILAWRKFGGKYTPEHRDVEYCISAEPLTDAYYILRESPCEIELFKDHFITSGLLSTIKSTNRIINVLGGIFAQENGYDNCLLLNEQKQVVEALNGNVFLVSGQTVKTPPLSDGCLNGIMRKQLISILRKMPQFNVVEDSISPFELQKADGLFITNVISGIIKVSKYRKKLYTSDFAKQVIPKLNLRAAGG